MTKDELIALIELLNRTPLTLAERLFVNGLMQRFQVEIAALEAAMEAEKKKATA